MVTLLGLVKLLVGYRVGMMEPQRPQEPDEVHYLVLKSAVTDCHASFCVSRTIFEGSYAWDFLQVSSGS